MDETIYKLIHMEESAKTALDALSKEKASLHRRIGEEIAHRKAAIDLKTEETIQTMYQTAMEEAQRKVDQIRRDSMESVTAVESDFEKHRDVWREKLISRILE